VDAFAVASSGGNGNMILGVFGEGSGEALFAKRASPVTLLKSLTL